MIRQNHLRKSTVCANASIYGSPSADGRGKLSFEFQRSSNLHMSFPREVCLYFSRKMLFLLLHSIRSKVFDVVCNYVGKSGVILVDSVEQHASPTTVRFHPSCAGALEGQAQVGRPAAAPALVPGRRGLRCEPPIELRLREAIARGECLPGFSQLHPDATALDAVDGPDHSRRICGDIVFAYPDNP